MEEAVRELLLGIDERFPGDDLEATPARVARAWREELLAGYATDPAAELTFTEVPSGGGLVLVRDLSFASVCVHHLLPFAGFAQIAYLPGRKLAGLSKIGRVVEAHARRLQIQERLGMEILKTIERVLEPRGALVLLDAEHTCMTLRGARKESSRMTTLVSSGVYEGDAPARSEVLALLGPRESAAR